MKWSIMGLVIASLLAATPALAGPDEAIKYRKGVMEGVGASFGGVFAVLKGDLDQQARLADITRLLALNASLAKDAFKTNTAGQGKERTTAKGDAIWANWADYAKRMDEFALASAALARVTAANPKDFKAIGDAAKPVAATCKGCHELYRQK